MSDHIEPAPDASARARTIELLAAINAGDRDAAERIVREHPEAAAGRGAAGESPVLAALYRGWDDLARQLSRARPLDLFEAAALGETSRVGALAAQAPDAIDALSADGWTALHLAAFLGHPESVYALIDAGATVDARSTNHMRNTPLCAAIAGRQDRQAIVALIEHGADVNVRAGGGYTPLHLAASRGVHNIVELLIQHGADASVAVESGETPADIANQRGFPDVARRLTDHVRRTGSHPAQQ